MSPEPEKPLYPAATILLLRDSPAEQNSVLEVMMVKRHHQIDFASGALVFPGGKVVQGDSEVPVNRIQNDHAISPEMLPFYLGALRECFEECGILLALDATTGEMINGERTASLSEYRPQLDSNTLTLGDFVEKEDLILAPGRLTHFAHWVGPKIAPKRFDTHFFLAKAPASQLAVHDGREAVDSLWIEPERAMEGQRQGEHTIIFPTRCNLEKLNESTSTEEAINRAENSSIVRVEPWLETRDDGGYLCIPAEAGYKTTAESIETAFR